jgi:BirA family biotin operon repressor/biotin-[acetyl-CoA-carboxylase] ligase
MVSPVTPSGFAVHRLGEVDSTNDWALAAARDGAPDGTVAVADFQRLGRGRLGRRWEAPPGSALLCSVLLRVALDPASRHLCSVAVALAALDGCEAAAGLRASCKWPNDLVVDDRKLAGILAETDGAVDHDGATPIVVGIGLNLTWPGPPDAHGTSILDATGRTVGRDAFLDAFLDALCGRDAALRDGAGRDGLVRDYRSRLATLGRRVRVELHERAVEGVAADVTAGGHLVVATDRGAVEVAAGDVVHLRAAVEERAEGRG